MKFKSKSLRRKEREEIFAQIDRQNSLKGRQKVFLWLPKQTNENWGDKQWVWLEYVYKQWWYEKTGLYTNKTWVYELIEHGEEKL